MRTPFALLLSFAVLLPGCSEPSGPALPALYLVEVSGEQFRVRVETEAQIGAMEARRRAGTTGVILGTLKAGDGGFNQPWSWHLDPASVVVPDAAIELCDGRPSFVEADLSYWIGTVKAFCPWGAHIVGRVR